VADTLLNTNAGSGGATFVADTDAAGGIIPYSKLAWGASGTVNRVAAGAGLPVAQDGSWAVSVNGTPSVAQSGAWSVSVNGTPSVAQSGVWGVTVQGNVSAVGDQATGVTVTTNPLLSAARAVTSEPVAVAHSTRSYINVDAVGKQIVLPYANPENFQMTAVAGVTAASAVLFAPAGAGVRSYLTEVMISNSSSTFSEVSLLDGATTVYIIPAPVTAGAAFALPTPLRFSANATVSCQASVAVARISVSASGYKGA